MDAREIRLDKIKITFLENDLCHFHFTNTEEEAEKADIVELHDTIKEHMTVDKCYMIISLDSGATMTQEARDYAASEAFDEIAAADAIIRADYSHEMAANFFIRFNRPHRPVRIFPDMDHAIAWINGLRDGQDMDNNT
ncbi:MAG: hypothetical protein HKN79_01470 [Flavobacteriales bacterium]|nr:hypothetical protein [Flavobacteriales bacterium]